MPRMFKKFYVFAFFIFGVFFYGVVLKNIGSAEQGGRDNALGPQDHPRGRINEETLKNHMSRLEDEIASQKLFSDSLLTKLKAKFQKSRDSKEFLSGKIDKSKGSSDKLLALQKELQDEAHVGEVRSDIEVEEEQKKGKKEDEFANGEVIDDHVPMPGKKLNTKGRKDQVIAVLVFVCDRPTVSRCLDKLISYRPSEKRFPIVVSQDCGDHQKTTEVLKAYDGRITHIKQPDLSEIAVPPKEKKMKGYYKIARHYGWALNQTFNVLNYDNVIIVEDDIEIAPDFFEYFDATLPLLKQDPTIWCVSAWNDNGKPKRINDTAYELLYRSDFFPGLGWMLDKTLWKEIMVKWPRGYWDDWMREPAQRRDRVCIRPEISRTSTFGKEGVSMGTYYMNHLRFIKLNNHFVPFTSLNLSYLLKDNYDVEFVRRVYSSQQVNSIDELFSITTKTRPTDSNPIEYRITYRTKTDFRIYAKRLELMEDFRAGVPRTAYRGVVSFMLNGFRCYLAPGANWESYQPV